MMAGGTVKVIHVADTHIDPTFRYLGPKELERRRDFLNAFYKVVSKARELKPDLLLVSGDLFDKVNPRNPARTQVMRAFRSLFREGIKIYVIGGNHDTPRSVEEGTSPIDELSAAGYVRFFSKVSRMEADTLRINGNYVCVSGATYNHTLPLESDPLETMKVPLEGDINIAMLHYNFSPVPPMWPAPTIKESNVPKDLNYLALGHYHRFRRIRLGNTLVVYPGSTERKSFQEEGDEKGFVYVELSPEGISKFEFIRTRARPLKTLSIHLPEDEEDPVGKVVSEARNYADKEAIIRLIISGKLPLDKLSRYQRERIIEGLRNDFFYIVINDRGLEYVFERAELADLETLSPIELYEKYFTELLEDPQNEGKKDLLQEALRLGKKYLEDVGAW